MTLTTLSLYNSRNRAGVARSCFCVFLWCVFVGGCYFLMVFDLFAKHFHIKIMIKKCSICME